MTLLYESSSRRVLKITVASELERTADSTVLKGKSVRWLTLFREDAKRLNQGLSP
jgi:hypothetical protein